MILDNDNDLLGDIIIEKHNNYFDIIFTKSYRCHVSDYKEKYCAVEHIDKDKVFDVYFIPYEKLGVKNLDELFLLLVKNPSETIRILTQNDVPVLGLIIEYYEK